MYMIHTLMVNVLYEETRLSIKDIKFQLAAKDLCCFIVDL